MAGGVNAKDGKASRSCQLFQIEKLPREESGEPFGPQTAFVGWRGILPYCSFDPRGFYPTTCLRLGVTECHRDEDGILKSSIIITILTFIGKQESIATWGHMRQIALAFGLVILYRVSILFECIWIRSKQIASIGYCLIVFDSSHFQIYLPTLLQIFVHVLKKIEHMYISSSLVSSQAHDRLQV